MTMLSTHRFMSQRVVMSYVNLGQFTVNNDSYIEAWLWEYQLNTVEMWTISLRLQYVNILFTLSCRSDPSCDGGCRGYWSYGRDCRTLGTRRLWHQGPYEVSTWKLPSQSSHLVTHQFSHKILPKIPYISPVKVRCWVLLSIQIYIGLCQCSAVCYHCGLVASYGDINLGQHWLR